MIGRKLILDASSEGEGSGMDESGLSCPAPSFLSFGN